MNFTCINLLPETSFVNKDQTYNEYCYDISLECVRFIFSLMKTYLQVICKLCYMYNHIKENRKQSLNKKRSIGQGISMLLYDQLFIYHLPFISNCYILIALRGKVMPNPQID